MKPLTLSIVIPAYNETFHIRACLDAIKKQTVAPDEIIVVDNNSTDNTAKIAKSYAGVTVIRAKDQGIVYARNVGFDVAGSSIIGRIDADTILPEDWVARAKDFYKDGTNNDYCLTGGCYFYNAFFPRAAGWLQSQIAFRTNRFLLGHYILFGSNMAIPKKIWDKVRLDVCLRTDIHEDLDLAIHVSLRGYQTTYHETLKVGIEARRLSENQHELLPNLLLWPNTLRVHHIKTWVFGWLGAMILYALGLMTAIIYQLFPALDDRVRKRNRTKLKIS